MMKTTCLDVTGIKRVEALIREYKKYICDKNEDYEPILREICKYSPAAGYYIAKVAEYSDEEIERIMFDSNVDYKVPAISEDINAVDYQAFFLDYIGMVLSYKNIDDFRIKLTDIANSVFAGLDKWYLTEKVNYMLPFLISLEDLFSDLDIFGDEILLYLIAFLFENEEVSQYAEVFEFQAIHLEEDLSYKIQNMSENGISRIKEYFQKIVEKENSFQLSSFIRRIDNDFDEYEDVFGLSQEEFIQKVLNVGTPMFVMPFRILRNYYSGVSTDDRWINVVKKYVTDKYVLNSCLAYDFYENVANELEKSSNEEVFFNYLTTKLDEIKNSLNEKYDKFTLKKIRYAQGKMFINIFNKGYDVERFIEILGKYNGFIHTKDYESIYKLWEYECNKDESISNFYKKYANPEKTVDPEKMVYLYMNTHLHQVESVRHLIESVCNILKNSGLSERKVEEKVAEIFSSYTIGGIVRRIDKEYSFKGLYTIEPTNLFMYPEDTWMIIHKSQDKSNLKEKCERLLQSDYDSGAKGHWRFDEDAKLYFKFTSVQSRRSTTYENAIIYVGDLWPQKDEEGRLTGVNVDNLKAMDAALNSASEWLEKFKDIEYLTSVVEARKHNEDMSKKRIDSPDNFQLIKSPHLRGRGSEFAIKILDIYTALMEHEEEFNLFYYQMLKNFIDNLNDFKYKPGLVNYNSGKVLFNNAEKYYIRKKGEEVLKANIPTKRKMQIYMSTCLKNVYYLDRFVVQLPKEDSPYLYSEVDDYMYYLFPVKLLGETEEEYRFKFAYGINSLYADELYIEKDKVRKEVLEAAQNNKTLFAEIYYFNGSKKKGQLYNVLTQPQIKADRGPTWRRTLFDLKRDRDAQKRMKRIRKIRNLMDSGISELSGDFIIQLVARFSYFFASGIEYNAFDMFNFFLSWNSFNGGDDIPAKENINKQTREIIEDTYEKLIENNSADKNNLQYILAIYKHTYIQFALSEEEFLNEMSETFQIGMEELQTLYNNDVIYTEAFNNLKSQNNHE